MRSVIMNDNKFLDCPYHINKFSSVAFNHNFRKQSYTFSAIKGTIVRIEDFYLNEKFQAGCYKLMSLESTDRGLINFVISPETYFVDHKTVNVGDDVTGFYDSSSPALLIYPPQYPAIVVSKNEVYQNVTVDYFDNELISRNGALKLNIESSTEVVLTNDQLFSIYPGNRNLIVIYGPTTKSIPAQAEPYKIIVLC